MSNNKFRFKTVQQVLHYYMENRGFHAESWQDLSSMTKVFVEVMGERELKDLTPENFNAYTAGRAKGVFGKRPAKSKGTIRRELIHLQTAIKFCEKSRLIDPSETPYIPLPEAPPPRTRWLTKEQLVQLKKAIIPGTRAEIFIKIALTTAARKRSIETLEWNQIDFETNIINFNKVGAPKTCKKRGVMPLSINLREFLVRLHDKSESTFVLGSSGDIRPHLNAVTRRAKLEGVTPHVFRHTWAAHACMNGVPMGEVARIMGDSIVTVEKVYAKFTPDYLKAAIEKAAL